MPQVNRGLTKVIIAAKLLFSEDYSRDQPRALKHLTHEQASQHCLAQLFKYQQAWVIIEGRLLIPPSLSSVIYKPDKASLICSDQKTTQGHLDMNQTLPQNCQNRSLTQLKRGGGTNVDSYRSRY